MPDFEVSHFGLMFGGADQCNAIQLANQKLGPSPACKPKLQQAGIYYLVSQQTTGTFFHSACVSEERFTIIFGGRKNGHVTKNGHQTRKQ